jgi:Zn-dependent alcohol dehydrogenase
VQAAKASGARRIFAIDVNSSKFEMAKKLGATDCVNPKDSDKPIQQVFHLFLSSLQLKSVVLVSCNSNLYANCFALTLQNLTCARGAGASGDVGRQLGH